MRKLSIVIALMLFATTAMFASETAKVGSKAPEFTLKDTKGVEHKISDFAGKYVVLEWVNFDCPFVKKHYESENMQNLQREFTKKGVIWLSICSSAKGKQGNFTTAELDKKKKDFKTAETAYLIDESGEVGKLYNAKVTPDMVIINPSQEVIYLGAIDNIPSTDKSDIDKADNYVMQALNSAMNGKTVEVKSSKPYGCGIKYANK
ncbi:MAG: thioredoxin family protein [Ignavibacteriae bacterium HGW-Ignavibacteriae-4]|jgi:peroxiredoxin|nr:MAG: thioredoxin family protein [Ignavibacteriae bacterium HGW-Ignavibacteriae-4]